ncbi:MAG: hypothetical protein Q8K78_09295 [Planctomycetaceae bacterium]|nr:hypothetical protein [Planctomycetaceae bacterium]
MSRRAIAIVSVLCLLGSVGFLTLEWTTRRYREPTYHCEVPIEFDDRERDDTGRPSTHNSQRFLKSRYYKYKVYHKYGWWNAGREWQGGTNMKSTPIPTNDMENRALADGCQQFHREKSKLWSLSW